MRADVLFTLSKRTMSYYGDRNLRVKKIKITNLRNSNDTE